LLRGEDQERSSWQQISLKALERDGGVCQIPIYSDGIIFAEIE
jgi:hypothetical protein